MKSYNNTLVVGGTGRNIGKTELICQLISKVSLSHTVYGVKITAIYPDEIIHHGDHSSIHSDYSLFEETRGDSSKDTSRMLRAGAQRVFYLQSNDANVLAGFLKIERLAPPHTVLICESNSLSAYISPGMFLMVKSSDGKIKPRARNYLDRADLVITSDGRSGFPDLNRIVFAAGRWQLATA